MYVPRSRESSQLTGPIQARPRVGPKLIEIPNHDPAKPRWPLAPTSRVEQRLEPGIGEEKPPDPANLPTGDAPHRRADHLEVRSSSIDKVDNTNHPQPMSTSEPAPRTQHEGVERIAIATHAPRNRTVVVRTWQRRNEVDKPVSPALDDRKPRHLNFDIDARRQLGEEMVRKGLGHAG